MGIQTMVYEGEYDLADQKVELSVGIGNGHAGAVVVQVGDQLVSGSPFVSGAVELVLGKPAELAGKKLLIFSTVAHTGGNNDALISYGLRGGEQTLTKDQTQTFPGENQPVRFRAEITFKA